VLPDSRAIDAVPAAVRRQKGISGAHVCLTPSISASKEPATT
jgi:hypothetical protein